MTKWTLLEETRCLGIPTFCVPGIEKLRVPYILEWGGIIVRVNIRRLFAYCALASWIGMTPAAIQTAIDWSARAAIEQATLEQRKELNSNLDTVAGNVPKNLSDVAKWQFQLNDELQSSAALDNKLASDSRAVQAKRKEFWWLFGIWSALTLLGSALLAEGKQKQPG